MAWVDSTPVLLLWSQLKLKVVQVILRHFLGVGAFYLPMSITSHDNLKAPRFPAKPHTSPCNGRPSISRAPSVRSSQIIKLNVFCRAEHFLPGQPKAEGAPSWADSQPPAILSSFSLPEMRAASDCGWGLHPTWWNAHHLFPVVTPCMKHWLMATAVLDLLISSGLSQAWASARTKQ